MQGDGGLCSVHSSMNPGLFVFHEIINWHSQVPCTVIEDQGLVLLSLPGSAAPPPRSNVYKSRAMTPRGPVTHRTSKCPLSTVPSLSVPPLRCMDAAPLRLTIGVGRVPTRCCPTLFLLPLLSSCRPGCSPRPMEPPARPPPSGPACSRQAPAPRAAGKPSTERRNPLSS